MVSKKEVVTVSVDVSPDIQAAARQRAEANPYDIEDYLPEYYALEFDWQFPE